MKKLLITLLIGIGFSGIILAKSVVWTCSQTSVDLNKNAARSEFPGSNDNFTMIIDDSTITVKTRVLVFDEYWSHTYIYTIVKHHFDDWYIAHETNKTGMLLVNLKTGKFSKSALSLGSISGSIGQCY